MDVAHVREREEILELILNAKNTIYVILAVYQGKKLNETLGDVVKDGNVNNVKIVKI
tara:strand:+ start:105 stop:275 length:171 start_codon:yes stop_codon:yes gene_type:complete